jgi:hypothetical protein
MEAVDFLAEAMSWRENPKRGIVLDIARQQILDDSYLDVESRWLRQDLAGDRLEVLEAMRTEAPEAIPEVLSEVKAQSSRSLVLLRHAGVL